MQRQDRRLRIIRTRVRMWFHFVAVIIVSIVSNMAALARKAEQVKAQVEKRGLPCPLEPNKNRAVPAPNGRKNEAPRDRPRLVLDQNNRSKTPTKIPPIPAFQTVQNNRKTNTEKNVVKPLKRQQYEEIEEGKGLIYDNGLTWEASPSPPFLSTGKGILRKQSALASASSSKQSIQKGKQPMRHVVFSNEPHHIRHYYSEKLFAGGPRQTVEKRKGQPQKQGNEKTAKVDTDLMIKMDALNIG